MNENLKGVKKSNVLFLRHMIVEDNTVITDLEKIGIKGYVNWPLAVAKCNNRYEVTHLPTGLYIGFFPLGVRLSGAKDRVNILCETFDDLETLSPESSFAKDFVKTFEELRDEEDEEEEEVQDTTALNVETLKQYSVSSIKHQIKDRTKVYTEFVFDDIYVSIRVRRADLYKLLSALGEDMILKFQVENEKEIETWKERRGEIYVSERRFHKVLRIHYGENSFGSGFQGSASLVEV